MRKIKISELFYSLQEEGQYVGDIIAWTEQDDGSYHLTKKANDAR